MSDLPSLDRLSDKVKVKGVGEDVESFVVGVGSVRLQRMRIFTHNLPVLTIQKRRLNKDTVLAGREVLAAHNLANEVDLRLVVSALTVLVRVGECVLVSDCVECALNGSGLFKLALLLHFIKF